MNVDALARRIVEALADSAVMLPLAADRRAMLERWQATVAGLLREATPPQPDTPFSHGDRVRKTGGDYTLEGVVAGIVRKKSGAVRYVVEADAPAGLLHIYNGSQLEAIEDK